MTTRTLELERAVARVPLLQVVPFDDLRRTCTHAAVRSVERNTNLWSSGQIPAGFSFVVQGRVKLIKPQATGKETILDFVDDGRLLCATIPYTCQKWCCTAIVDRDDTVVLSLLRQQVLELMAKHPLLIQGLLGELACRTTVLCSRISEMGAGKVEQRIALLLMRLTEQMGIDEGADGYWIPMALSRRDLAELCGTTVETSIRTMCKLEKDGVVVTRSRGFHVRNKKALGEIAEGLSPRSLLSRRV